MFQTWWLIEVGSPANYYCSPGEWCSNANHAKKFATHAEASKVADSMGPVVGGPIHVVEHAWCMRV